MPAFSVLEPPRRNSSASVHADRYVFLRERFSLAAFLFGPVWMIWCRLGIVLIIYLIITGSIAIGMQLMDIGWSAGSAVYVFIQLLIGLEATNLRRWTRIRRGWRDCGAVIADDLEMAERRFFDARAIRRPVAISTSSPLAATPVGTAGSEIVGLFPEPGGGR